MKSGLKKILPCFVMFIFDILLCSNIANEKTNKHKLDKLLGEYKNKIENKIRNLEGINHLGQIFGNSSSLNYYYLNLFLGNPPKKQSLIIDTGSHLTSVPCEQLCESCGKHLNSYFSISGKKFFKSYRKY